MILKEDEQWFDFHHNLEKLAHTHHAFRILDLNFDPKNRVPGDDVALWNKQVNYMNLIFKYHLKTTALITICNFSFLLSR